MGAVKNWKMIAMITFVQSRGSPTRITVPRMTKTNPKVRHLVAACRRMNTSANRKTPTVPTVMKKRPKKIEAMAAQPRKSLIEDPPALDELGEHHGDEEPGDGEHKDGFEEVGRSHDD